MAQCKKCGIILQNLGGPGRPPDYCADCQINRNREWQSTFKKRHDRFLGNPKDDIKILRILRKKQKNADKRYNN